MHVNILFNGCSYTAVEWGELGENPEEKRFSKLVANKLNVSECNIAIQGSSNDSIVRRTIEWVEEGNTCDIAVVLLTHEERIEIPVYSKVKQYYAVSFGRALALMNGNRLKSFYENANDCDLMFYKHVYTEKYGYHNIYKNRYILEQYFKSKNIPLILFQYCPTVAIKNDCIWQSLCNDVELDYVVSSNKHTIERLIDNYVSKFLKNSRKKDSILGEWMNEKYYTNQYNDDKTHFNKEGHIKVAEYIVEKIKERNLDVF
jgi:hypothetical protein